MRLVVSGGLLGKAGSNGLTLSDETATISSSLTDFGEVGDDPEAGDVTGGVDSFLGLGWIRGFGGSEGFAATAGFDSLAVGFGGASAGDVLVGAYFCLRSVCFDNSSTGAAFRFAGFGARGGGLFGDVGRSPHLLSCVSSLSDDNCDACTLSGRFSNLVNDLGEAAGFTDSAPLVLDARGLVSWDVAATTSGESNTESVPVPANDQRCLGS